MTLSSLFEMTSESLQVDKTQMKETHKVAVVMGSDSDLETMQPSLFDKTTTGFFLILGLNNLSQET